MFTGIVEEIGIIKEIRKNSLGLDIVIEAKEVLTDLKLGDSVAINGCCQTVTEISQNTFKVQAVPETVNLTNFKFLRQNNEVNLERAATLNSRLGGHLVTGHVDGLGEIISIKNVGNSTIFEIETEQSIMKYIIYKGSITINGISLTVCELRHNSFAVSIIPHTLENTILKNAKIGDKVNLEPDMIAKYVEKMLIKEDNSNSKITLEFLKENGF